MFHLVVHAEKPSVVEKGKKKCGGLFERNINFGCAIAESLYRFRAFAVQGGLEISLESVRLGDSSVIR